MSLAETKPVIPITKSLPLSMVSNLYRYVPTGAGGFSSPTQLYSPAPVRSGKTPMSPVAPLDTQYAFAAELTDDDDDENDHDHDAHDVVDDFPSYASVSNNPSHPFYRVSCIQPGTKVPKDAVTGLESSQSVTDQSSLISPLNLSIPTKPMPCMTNSTTLDRLDAPSRLQPTQTNTFDMISRVVKSYSVMDFDPRHDEEFTFRMQAEPFSLARDSVATGELCVGVVCDDCTLHDDLSTQSVMEKTNLLLEVGQSCEPNEPVCKQPAPTSEESAVNPSANQRPESLDLKTTQSCEE